MSEFLDARDAVEKALGSVDWKDPKVRYYATLDKIAIAICEYRRERNLSQTALAKRLGITQAMVSKYESGDYNISLKALFELLGALGISFDLNIGKKPEADRLADAVEIQEEYVCAPESKDDFSEESMDIFFSAS